MRISRFVVVAAAATLVLTAGVSGAAASGSGHANTHASGTAIESMPIFRAGGGRGRPGGGGGGGSANLVSGGGAVQATPRVYISWWGPEWATGFSSGGYSSAQGQGYMRDFFTNVGGSAWNSVVTQYCQGIAAGTSSCSGGSAFVGNQSGMLADDWIDQTPVPARPRQSDIQKAASRLATHFGAVNPNATYFVFTPSGKSMQGFKTSWCAWHSSSGSLAYAYMPYIPDAGAGCGMNFVNKTNNPYGNGYFDGFSIVGGHEFSEAETDPYPSSGWTDSGGSENADKCAWHSDATNISLGGQLFAVQSTWSNASSGCALSLP